MNLDQAHTFQQDGTVTNDKRDEMIGVAREFFDKNATMTLSPLMLAQYADQHMGTCIGFSRTTEKALGDDDIKSPVLYSDIRFSEILKQDGSITRKLLITKENDWAYEREWLLLTDSGDDCKAISGNIFERI